MSAQEQFQSHLADQLAMNRETWKALVEHGLTPETEVRLDFFYFARGKEQAERFREYLRSETDYDVAVESSGNGPSHEWAISGRTQKVKITLEILDQWVTWMAVRGCERGCLFDGWGTSV